MPLSGSGMMSASEESRARRCLRGGWLCALYDCDGGHHAGFGSIGDHADDVEEKFLAFGQGMEFVLLVELGDGDVPWRCLALLLELLSLGVNGVALGLEAGGGPSAPPSRARPALPGQPTRRGEPAPLRPRQLPHDGCG